MLDFEIKPLSDILERQAQLRVLSNGHCVIEEVLLPKNPESRQKEELALELMREGRAFSFSEPTGLIDIDQIKVPALTKYINEKLLQLRTTTGFSNPMFSGDEITIESCSLIGIKTKNFKQSFSFYAVFNVFEEETVYLINGIYLLRIYLDKGNYRISVDSPNLNCLIFTTEEERKEYVMQIMQSLQQIIQ